MYLEKLSYTQYLAYLCMNRKKHTFFFEVLGKTSVFGVFGKKTLPFFLKKCLSSLLILNYFLYQELLYFQNHLSYLMRDFFWKPKKGDPRLVNINRYFSSAQTHNFSGRVGLCRPDTPLLQGITRICIKFLLNFHLITLS